ncbi:glutamate racemase [Marinithermofilum abyssi]|nr:glutamate racemase [Marinithermofilum abyssi]
MGFDSSPKAIGILDSGVGGLTVAKEIMRQLPKERMIYFGDTARCPYGPRSPEEVRQFTDEIVAFLTRFPLKALVIACNTATAVALGKVREWLSIPVFGVVDPGARAAIKASSQGRIGVIGTEGTVRSEAYEGALKRIDPHLFVVSLACPTLVPLVESGEGDTKRARRIVRQALAPIKQYDLDTLILGCTHYPLISDLIRREMGPDVTLISSAEETAREISTVLHHKGLLHLSDAVDHGHRFYTTGHPGAFRRIAEQWLNQEVEVEQVALEPAVQNPIG